MSQSVSPYELCHIYILDKDNYSTWKIRITFVLKKNKIWSIVDGSKPNPLVPIEICAIPLPSTRNIVHWEDRNMFAQKILINGVKNYCLHHIARSNTTEEGWDELETIYRVHNISNRV